MLSPYMIKEGSSPTASSFLSPRHSAMARQSQKRVLSISPLSSEGMIDVISNVIRTSPTSLVAFINGTQNSSNSASPQFGLHNPSGFGHLSARNSPYSCSGSSGNRATNYTPSSCLSLTKKDPDFNETTLNPYVGPPEGQGLDMQMSNQVVAPQSQIPNVEQQFSYHYHSDNYNNLGVNPYNYNGFNSRNQNRPPPSYLQSIQQQQANSQRDSQPRVATKQQQTKQVAPLRTQNNNYANTHVETPAQSQKYLEEEDDTENVNLCKWIDCDVLFETMDELVRHIEKVHIDQRKGEEFTCFWQACPRRYKPFNARYKLLIHMRVHSGEKPNKCTVSFGVKRCLMSCF